MSNYTVTETAIKTLAIAEAQKFCAAYKAPETDELAPNEPEHSACAYRTDNIRVSTNPDQQVEVTIAMDYTIAGAVTAKTVGTGKLVLTLTDNWGWSAVPSVPRKLETA